VDLSKCTWGKTISSQGQIILLENVEMFQVFVYDGQLHIELQKIPIFFEKTHLSEAKKHPVFRG